jgi:hypothetical protein
MAGQAETRLSQFTTSEVGSPGDVVYHSSRSIEELDNAEAARDKDARQAHEQLASLHLRTAAGLCSGDLWRIVADRVD